MSFPLVNAPSRKDGYEPGHLQLLCNTRPIELLRKLTLLDLALHCISQMVASELIGLQNLIITTLTIYNLPSFWTLPLMDMNTPLIPFNLKEIQHLLLGCSASQLRSFQMLQPLKFIFASEWHPSSVKSFTNFIDQAVLL